MPDTADLELIEHLQQQLDNATARFSSTDHPEYMQGWNDALDVVAGWLVKWRDGDRAQS